MDLHQIQVNYQFTEDRILFRASFRDNDGSLQEIRAWITRRLFHVLWPGIIDSLKTQVKLEKPQAVHASAEIVSMDHTANVTAMKDSGDFSNQFEPQAQNYPYGKMPLLITKASFTIAANRPVCIHFVSEEGKGFEIAFTPRLLHGFCKLLMEAEAKAQWNLNPVLPGEALLPKTSAVLN